MRTPSRLLVLAALLVCLPACSSSTAQPPPPPPPSTHSPQPAGGHAGTIRYVALGDSFTAGPLIVPAADDAPAMCLRSAAGYPGYLAAYLGVRSLTDVSCSGATTADLYASQGARMGLPADAAGDRPAQLAAVTADTTLVSVGIGGNDANLFGNLFAALSSGAGLAAGLRDARAVEPRIAAALAAIRGRAPKARILVVGYLRVLPADGECRDLTGTPAVTLRALDRIERALNASLRTAAAAGGADFIDAYALSTGHDMCAGAEAWINGSTTDISRAAPYDPFRAGMDALAREMFTRVRRQPAPASPDTAALLRVPR